MTVRNYDKADHAALDLAAGRIDAIFTARSAAEAITKAGLPVVSAGQLMAGGPLGRGAVTRKGDPLTGRLSAAIEAAGRDGTTAALSRKWFGFDLSRCLPNTYRALLKLLQYQNYVRIQRLDLALAAPASALVDYPG